MLSRVSAFAVALAIAALPVRAQTPPVDATAPSTAPSTAPAVAVPPPAVTTSDDAAATTADRTPPMVSDLTVASDNPEAAPVISANVADDVGVVSSVVYWRAKGGAWMTTALVGNGAFRIARLDDGAQRAGFDFYVEVKDAAGNVTTSGTRTSPLKVVPATEGNTQRVQRELAADTVVRGPHPGWIMLSLGVGVAAAAGAGIFGYDLVLTNTRMTAIDDELNGDVTDQRRRDLERTQTALEKVATQDTAAAAILGVVGLAGLTTGVVLLVMAVGAQE